MARVSTGQRIIGAQDDDSASFAISEKMREHIVGSSSGGANIWIENLNIQNRADGSIIKFSGTDYFLIVKGTNTINYFGDGSLSIRNVGRATCSGIGVNEGYHNSFDEHHD